MRISTNDTLTVNKVAEADNREMLAHLRRIARQQGWRCAKWRFEVVRDGLCKHAKSAPAW